MRLGTLLLSLLIALMLWGMAHGTASIDRGFDVPVVFDGIPDHLVLTEQSTDAVNIRVLGNPTSLRNLADRRVDYRIDVSGARSGPSVHEVEASVIELPRGARIVSRSPSRIEYEFEPRGRKSVRVRAAVEGAPAEGYHITRVEVDPPSVGLTGARREVLRLSEVSTETIGVEGLTAPVERVVRLSPGRDHVWPEKRDTVTVRIDVEPIPEPKDLEEGILPRETGAAEPEGGEA
jgi:YbbR domain-containing protein